LVVAGEASGDALGAKIVEEIGSIQPDSRFYGAAGTRMAAAGVEVDIEIDSWSVTGIVPVVLAIPAFLSRLRQIKKIAGERKPDLVLLIDFPEFNLKLAKALKNQGQRVVYYVSPQLWAWRKYRAKTIREHVDLLISILPFEKKWYEERGIVNVAYVGNPIVDKVVPTTSKEDLCTRFGLDPAKPIIAMLPGSRSKELRFHLPLMIGAARNILAGDPAVQFVFAAAGPKQFETIRDAISDDVGFLAVEGETHNLLGSADAAAISSGTATLEAGIIGTPMAIVYKMSRLDAVILGPLVNVENVGLINLVAGKRIAREFVQNEFTVEALSTELVRLMEPEANRAMRKDLKQATEKLGENASAKAAELVVQFARKQT